MYRARDTRLDRDVAVMVLDFGLAKDLDDQRVDSETQAPTITQRMTGEGTIRVRQVLATAPLYDNTLAALRV